MNKVVSDNCFIKSYTSKTKAGTNADGAKKTNQDSFIAKTNIFGCDNFALFSVFDGHGIE